jgi:hypothetical protein
MRSAVACGVSVAGNHLGSLWVWERCLQRIEEVNSLWPNPGLKIAMHSPKALIETGLHMCPPEKTRDVHAVADEQCVL